MTEHDLDAQQIRHRQRTNWTVAAAGWTQRRSEMSESTRPVTERLIAAARIGPGQRVLDLASGVGDPAIAIAEAVGPNGSVLGLDITQAMLDGAIAYARDQHIANVAFRAIPSETDLGVQPDSFDAATCRWGLMFMADPVAALRAIRDALRPGGRMAFSTWGPPERVPFMNFAGGIVGRYATLPPPAPGPNQFSLPTTEALIGILTEAGFTDPNAESFELAMMAAPDAAGLWEMATQVSGAVAEALAALPPETREVIRREAIATIEARFGAGPVSLGGEALVASGAKPS